MSWDCKILRRISLSLDRISVHWPRIIGHLVIHTVRAQSEYGGSRHYIRSNQTSVQREPHRSSELNEILYEQCRKMTWCTEIRNKPRCNVSHVLTAPQPYFLFRTYFFNSVFPRISVCTVLNREKTCSVPIETNGWHLWKKNFVLLSNKLRVKFEPFGNLHQISTALFNILIFRILQIALELCR